MTINYLEQSEKYRPNVIENLLVGEAPPPNGKSYFYLPTTLTNGNTIRNDRSLPATIFCHYFSNRPNSHEEYESYLQKLKEKGIFLIDIYDDPIKVRGSKEGEEKIIDTIPKLRNKLESRDIHVAEKDMIFLLARNSYKRHIRQYFPRARHVAWIDFRMENINNET